MQAVSLPDINMNKMKIFVPNWDGREERHAHRFFVYYQTGVSVCLFSKVWHEIKYIDFLTLLLVCI